MDQAANDLKNLRRQMIRRRRSLTEHELRIAAADAARLFWRQPESRRCRRIAAYFANRGELGCESIIREAWTRGRQVYLPVLHRGELSFARFRPDEKLVLNRYGIPEPLIDDGQLIRPSELDLVFAPLVAFDLSGTRIGMGGGYYDRSFRFLQFRDRWLKPRLIGLGYEFQRVACLQRRPWDIPMRSVLTEKNFYRF